MSTMTKAWVRWGGCCAVKVIGVGAGSIKNRPVRASRPIAHRSLTWGVVSPSSGLGIAFITDNVLLDLELTAMEKAAMAK